MATKVAQTAWTTGNSPGGDCDAAVRSAPPVPALVSRGAWLAEVLKDRILNGRYRPGERIREADLQREFGFSNGPVREALRLTIAATLAESGAPWQGVHVVKLDRAEIGELFQLRTALLKYIAGRAARFASPEVLERGHALKADLAEAFARSRERPPSFGGALSSWLLEGAGNAMHGTASRSAPAFTSTTRFAARGAWARWPGFPR